MESLYHTLVFIDFENRKIYFFPHPSDEEKKERKGRSGIDLEDFYSKERASEEDKQGDFNFLSEFYVYCQQVPDFRIPWSKWIQQRLLVLGDSRPLDSSFQTSRILKNKRTFHERAISDAVSEISEVLYSFKCGYEVKAELKHDKDGWSHKETVEVNNKNGDYGRAEFEQKSDGTTTISGAGGRK